MPPTQSRLKAALALASNGWRVFPLYHPKGDLCSCGKGAGHPIGKHPISRGWQQEATTDADQITKWWKKNPESNIGIATGKESNLIVLDIDGKEGEDMVAKSGHEPTVTVKTGKGRQLYFVHPGERVRNKVGRFPQLDSRGDGGYVVAPGSLHQSGNLYHFVEGARPGDVPLAKAPKWWLEVVVDGAPDSRAEEAERSENRGPVIKGRRNSALASIAGSLRDKGLSVEAIRFALRDFNKSNCQPPLEEDEVDKIAQSYGRYPKGEPDKKYKISELADLLRKDRHFLTSPIDSDGQGVKLLLYGDGCFRPNGADVARRMADRILGNASRPDTINSVVELIKERTKTPEELLNPKALNLVNTISGMVDWRTGELSPHDPELLSTFQINAEYKPDHTEAGVPGVECKRLDKFLADVFPADAQDLVDEIVGYLMIPSCEFQKAIMLVGEGANGKSTFLHVVSNFLNECNVSRMSLQQLEDSPFSAAELQGKLANIYADIPNSKLEKSDTFKSLVAGDPIKAERKYGHPFTLQTRARLIFSANAFPKSADSSNAYFRRWIVIPFPNRFEGRNADPDLVRKLTTPEAMSRLLNRGLAGLRRLKANGGFSVPKSSEAQVEAYKVENDSSYEFIRERLKSSDGGDSKLPKVEVYEKYIQWCQASGIKHPVNQRKLNHTIEQATGAKEVQHGPKRVRCWSGLEYSQDDGASKGDSKY